MIDCQDCLSDGADFLEYKPLEIVHQLSHKQSFIFLRLYYHVTIIYIAKR